MLQYASVAVLYQSRCAEGTTDESHSKWQGLWPSVKYMHKQIHYLTVNKTHFRHQHQLVHLFGFISNEMFRILCCRCRLTLFNITFGRPNQANGFFYSRLFRVYVLVSGGNSCVLRAVNFSMGRFSFRTLISFRTRSRLEPDLRI